MGKRLRKRSKKQPVSVTLEKGYDVHIDVVDTEGIPKKTRTYSLESDAETLVKTDVSSEPESPEIIEVDVKDEDVLDEFYDLSRSELASVMCDTVDEFVESTTSRRADELETNDVNVRTMVGSDVAHVVKVEVGDGGRYTYQLGTGADKMTLSAGEQSPGGDAKRDEPEPAAPVEVDRFVICSFGQMECQLCEFYTGDYSTFKSHIICSHPSWRITKKLSKNRLLVEKSARVTPTINDDRGRAAKLLSATATERRSSPAQRGVSSVSDSHVEEDGSKKRHQYRCRRCQRLFYSKETATRHQMVFHGATSSEIAAEEIDASWDRGATFAPLRQASDALDKDDLVYRCQICGFTAECPKAVQTHALRMHHEQLMMFGLAD